MNTRGHLRVKSLQVPDRLIKLCGGKIAFVIATAI